MLDAILRDAQARAAAQAPVVGREELIASIYAAKYTGPVLVHFKSGLPETYEFHPMVKVNVK